MGRKDKTAAIKTTRAVLSKKSHAQKQDQVPPEIRAAYLRFRDALSSRGKRAAFEALPSLIRVASEKPCGAGCLALGKAHLLLALDSAEDAKIYNPRELDKCHTAIVTWLTQAADHAARGAIEFHCVPCIPLACFALNSCTPFSQQFEEREKIIEKLRYGTLELPDDGKGGTTNKLSLSSSTSPPPAAAAASKRDTPFHKLRLDAYGSKNKTNAERSASPDASSVWFVSKDITWSPAQHDVINDGDAWLFEEAATWERGRGVSHLLEFAAYMLSECWDDSVKGQVLIMKTMRSMTEVNDSANSINVERKPFSADPKSPLLDDVDNQLQEVGETVGGGVGSQDSKQNVKKLKQQVDDAILKHRGHFKKVMSMPLCLPKSEAAKRLPLGIAKKLKPKDLEPLQLLTFFKKLVKELPATTAAQKHGRKLLDIQEAERVKKEKERKEAQRTQNREHPASSISLPTYSKTMVNDAAERATVVKRYLDRVIQEHRPNDAASELALIANTLRMNAEELYVALQSDLRHSATWTCDDTEASHAVWSYKKDPGVSAWFPSSTKKVHFTCLEFQQAVLQQARRDLQDQAIRGSLLSDVQARFPQKAASAFRKLESGTLFDVDTLSGASSLSTSLPETRIYATPIASANAHQGSDFGLKLYPSDNAYITKDQNSRMRNSRGSLAAQFVGNSAVVTTRMDYSGAGIAQPIDHEDSPRQRGAVSAIDEDGDFAHHAVENAEDAEEKEEDGKYNSEFTSDSSLNARTLSVSDDRLAGDGPVDGSREPSISSTSDITSIDVEDAYISSVGAGSSDADDTLGAWHRNVDGCRAAEAAACGRPSPEEELNAAIDRAQSEVEAARFYGDYVLRLQAGMECCEKICSEEHHLPWNPHNDRYTDLLTEMTPDGDMSSDEALSAWMSLHSLLRPAFIGMIYLNLELDSIETRSGPIWLEKVTAADRAHADLLGKVFMLALNDECYAREEKYRDMQTLVLQKCRLACSALYAAYKDGNAGCSNLPDPRVVKFLAVRDVLAYALQKRLLKTHCPVTDVEQVFLEEDIRNYKLDLVKRAKQGLHLLQKSQRLTKSAFAVIERVLLSQLPPQALKGLSGTTTTCLDRLGYLRLQELEMLVVFVSWLLGNAVMEYAELDVELQDAQQRHHACLKVVHEASGEVEFVGAAQGLKEQCRSYALENLNANVEVCRELSSQVALWATGVVVSKDRANEENSARAASRTGATPKQPRGTGSAGSRNLEANSESNVLRPDWVPDGYRLDLQEPYLTGTYGREQDAKMYREALRKALMLGDFAQQAARQLRHSYETIKHAHESWQRLRNTLSSRDTGPYRAATPSSLNLELEEAETVALNVFQGFESDCEMRQLLEMIRAVPFEPSWPLSWRTKTPTDPEITGQLYPLTDIALRPLNCSMDDVIRAFDCAAEGARSIICCMDETLDALECLADACYFSSLQLVKVYRKDVAVNTLDCIGRLLVGRALPRLWKSTVGNCHGQTQQDKEKLLAAQAAMEQLLAEEDAEVARKEAAARKKAKRKNKKAVTDDDEDDGGGASTHFAHINDGSDHVHGAVDSNESDMNGDHNSVEACKSAAVSIGKDKIEDPSGAIDDGRDTDDVDDSSSSMADDDEAMAAMMLKLRNVQKSTASKPDRPTSSHPPNTVPKHSVSSSVAGSNAAFAAAAPSTAPALSLPLPRARDPIKSSQPMHQPTPRVISWAGDWECRCGRRYEPRDHCVDCGIQICRRYLSGESCRRYFRAGQTSCKHAHPAFDLPTPEPPASMPLKLIRVRNPSVWPVEKQRAAGVQIVVVRVGNAAHAASSEGARIEAQQQQKSLQHRAQNNQKHSSERSPAVLLSSPVPPLPSSQQTQQHATIVLHQAKGKGAEQAALRSSGAESGHATADTVIPPQHAPLVSPPCGRSRATGRATPPRSTTPPPASDISTSSGSPAALLTFPQQQAPTTTSLVQGHWTSPSVSLSTFDAASMHSTVMDDAAAGGDVRAQSYMTSGSAVLPDRSGSSFHTATSQHVVVGSHHLDPAFAAHTTLQSHEIDSLSVLPPLPAPAPVPAHHPPSSRVPSGGSTSLFASAHMEDHDSLSTRSSASSAHVWGPSSATRTFSLFSAVPSVDTVSVAGAHTDTSTSTATVAGGGSLWAPWTTPDLLPAGQQGGNDEIPLRSCSASQVVTGDASAVVSSANGSGVGDFHAMLLQSGDGGGGGLALEHALKRNDLALGQLPSLQLPPPQQQQTAPPSQDSFGGSDASSALGAPLGAESLNFSSSSHVGAPLAGYQQQHFHHNYPVDTDYSSLLMDLGVDSSFSNPQGSTAQSQVLTAGAAAPPGSWRSAVMASVEEELGRLNAPGLLNEAGEYNCFLNVVIQCLWHLDAFSSRVTTRPVEACGQNPVVIALKRLFEAFYRCGTNRMGLDMVVQQQRSVVDPRQLREALSQTCGDRFGLGEMNDVGDLLMTLYAQMRHCGPLGQAAIDEVFGLKVREYIRCDACGGRESHRSEYVQYFFNVSATALRLQRMLMGPTASTARLLRSIESSMQKSCDTDLGGCDRRLAVQQTLCYFPAVFTLQLAWESNIETSSDIYGTLDAVDESVHLHDLYSEVIVRGSTSDACAGDNGSFTHPLAPYNLRCVVCYYGAHYSAFVYTPEVRAWVMFDDASVTKIGSWRDVVKRCERGRIQPSVLFYTR